MGKVAFIFPGQGAQYIGMAKEFYEKEDISGEIFRRASQITGIDIPTLCFEEKEKLDITEYTQIAMVTAELAIYKVLEKKGYRPDVTAGLSLGEYSAIVAAGVMRAEDAFAIVRRRGIYMQEAVPEGGAMAAVLGLECKVIEDVCQAAKGVVSVANYNCPGQTVITGEADAVFGVGEILKEKGARRVIPLNVSGPFHSAMLVCAGERLSKDLEKIPLSDFSIPYVANLTADYVRDTEPVKGLLREQISSPVRWQQSVERMIADGVDTFVEIGPGKTLSGFIKKIDRQVCVTNIDKYEDLERVTEVLKNA